jgi:Ca-activated chloride channel family protein
MPHFLKNTLLLPLLLPLSLFAQSSRTQLQQGDRLYDQKEWSKAEESYRKSGPGAAASYNTGNAAYQQGKYDAAAEAFKKAAAASTPVARADAFFNLGNAYLQQGKYKEAIAAYENSLRRQPNRFDAKKNLQIAKKKWKEQQEPPPPPQKTPPPPPPPPKPQRNYLDRAQQPQKREVPSVALSTDAAKQILTTIVAPDEQKSAREYRQLAPATKPSRVKKDW